MKRTRHSRDDIDVGSLTYGGYHIATKNEKGNTRKAHLHWRGDHYTVTIIKEEEFPGEFETVGDAVGHLVEYWKRPEDGGTPSDGPQSSPEKE